MRFVLVSFAFMGWAFYEMSGGADFEPRGVRPAPQEKVARITKPLPEPVVAPVATDQLIAKRVLKRRKTTTAVPATTTPDQSRQDAIARLAQVSTLGATSNLFAEPSGQTVTLASLDQGALALETRTDAPQPAATALLAEPQPDLREIAGTRVNMRQGPGTIYPVIARLNIGHKVEVLDDSGNGWLRLRVLPERSIGWISASLVSKKAN